MENFCINLNIHYTVPPEVCEKIEKVYSEMPEWRGFVDGFPKWYLQDGKLIEACFEPGGLQVYAELPEKEWNEWLQLFKDQLTQALGYPIGEPEDGYDFKYWD